MRAKSALVGVALGVWWAAHLGLWQVLSSSDWLTGADLPDELRYPPSFFLGPGGGPLLGSVLLLVGVLLVLIWSSLENEFAIDPERKAWGSIEWTARIILRLPMLMLVGTVLLLFYLFIQFDCLGFILVAAAGLFLLLVPLAVFRRETVSSVADARWWWPRWPGWTPLAMVGILWTVTLLVGLSLGFLPRPHWSLSIIVEIVGWLAGVALPMAVAAILIFRPSWSDILRHRHQYTAKRTIGPAIALEARVLLLSLFALAPIVSIWLWGWKILPVHWQWLAEQGLEMPALLVLFIQGVHIVGRFWWILLLFPPIALIECLLVGRLVWLIADGSAVMAPNKSLKPTRSARGLAPNR